VSHIRTRPVDETGRRVIIDPGVTARDLGGVGRIPAPIESGRRTMPERRDATTPPDRRAVTDPNATPDVGREFDDPRGGVPERRAEPAVDQGGDGGRRATQPDQGNTARPRPGGQDVTRPLPQLERRETEKPPPSQPETREPRRDVPTRPAVERPREPVRQADPPKSPQPERRAQPQTREPERRPAPQTSREPERRPTPPASREPERRQAEPRAEPRSSAPAQQPERTPDARRRAS
jgi:hypothetical protein